MKASRRFLMAALAIITTLATIPVAASTSKRAKVSKSKSTSANKLGAELGTDFNFNDLTVRGQYQSGGEGIATVENEKALQDLLDYRSEYKDRLVRSAGQL